MSPCRKIEFFRLDGLPYRLRRRHLDSRNVLLVQRFCVTLQPVTQIRKPHKVTSTWARRRRYRPIKSISNRIIWVSSRMPNKRTEWLNADRILLFRPSLSLWIKHVYFCKSYLHTYTRIYNIIICFIVTKKSRPIFKSNVSNHTIYSAIIHTCLVSVKLINNRVDDR